MGAWGALPFENDSALDFVEEIEDGDHASAIEELFSDCAPSYSEADFSPETITYIDGHEGSMIVAFGQMLIDQLQGEIDEEIPELEFSEETLKSYLVQVLPFLQKVGESAETSELYELWEENEELFPTWLASIKNIQDAAARLLY